MLANFLCSATLFCPMSERLNTDPGEGITNSVVVEATRQFQLEGKNLSMVISDADLLTLLLQARSVVESKFKITEGNEDIHVPYNDHEHGEMVGFVPRKIVLILAEL